jgi:4-hydroxybenzoate polyprenyltransferase
MLQALRPHQWLKNILLFVPLLVSHQYNDLVQMQNVIMAFVLFSLTASSVYLINDCFDIKADKEHPIKKNRAVASGQISVFYALNIASILALGSFYLSSLISSSYTIILVSYFLISFLYSYQLKKIVLMDVFVLAFLYTFRIITGAVVINVEPSFWLLGFSIFFFLSLALVKRVSELLNLTNDNKTTAIGRGYEINDIALLTIKGVVSGFVAVVIMALYINSNEVLEHYKNPQFIWLIIPLLLYWISIIWLITYRGKMHTDPVYFAIKDKRSWLVFMLIVICVLFAKGYFNVVAITKIISIIIFRWS